VPVIIARLQDQANGSKLDDFNGRLGCWGMPFPMLRVLIGSTLTADKFQRTKTLPDGYVLDIGMF